jgi:hypothetical protein
MREGRYFECSEVATALAYKLMEKGTVYERKLGVHTLFQMPPWQPVVGFHGVRDLVFRSLLTLYLGSSNNSGTASSEAIAALSATGIPTQAQRGAREGALVGGAQWLLQAASPNAATGRADPESMHAPPKMRFKRHRDELQGYSSPLSLRTQEPPRRDRNSFRGDEKRMHIAGQQSSSRSLQIASSNGRSSSANSGELIRDVHTNDIVCGLRREDGVLNINHPGNLLFHQRIKATLDKFASASTPDKGQLAMNCVDMIHRLSGRFLVEAHGHRSSSRTYFAELSLEEARWRAYWTLEKRQAATGISGGQHVATSAGGRGSPLVSSRASSRKESSSLSPVRVVTAEASAAPVIDVDAEPVVVPQLDAAYGKESPPVVIEHIPTHLTYASKVDNAARALHPVAVKTQDETAGALATESEASEPNSEAKEPTEKDIALMKADRARRRHEKLQRAKTILSGGRYGADPFTDMAKLREKSVEELKKRHHQKRHEDHKGRAAWDLDE